MRSVCPAYSTQILNMCDYMLKVFLSNTSYLMSSVLRQWKTKTYMPRIRLFEIGRIDIAKK